MVNATLKRGLTAALAAVVLFMALVPVPTGYAAFDRLRAQRAYAGPEAVLLGSQQLLLATAVGVAGLYVVGNTNGEWLENAAGLASDFGAFVSANGYVNEYNCDLSKYVDSAGNFDVQAAYNGGFYDMLQAYLQSENAQALLTDGTISNAVEKPVYKEYAGYAFNTTNKIPYLELYLTDSAFKRRVLTEGYQVVAYQYLEHVDGAEKYRVWLSGVPKELYYQYNDGNPYLYANSFMKYDFKVKNNTLIGGSVGGNYNMSVYTDNSGAILNESAVITVNGSTLENVPGASPYVGVFDPATVSARIGEIANGALSKVGVFEPTAEQLEQGYTFEDIVSGELNGIHTGIDALDDVLNSILNVLRPMAAITVGPFTWLAAWWASVNGWWGHLLDWIDSLPLGSFCSTVVDWVGSTPFGDVIGDLSGDVVGALQGVLNGVLSIPGAIEGVLEGVIEGVQAIPGVIQGVIEAIQSGVIDLTGALEGLMPFDPFHFELPQITPGKFALPTSLQEGLNVSLADKVPFCYVIRSYTAIGNMFANFSDNRSFYLDFEIPYAGTVSVDGEMVLSQRLGENDIATTIRILATSLLCLGLLYRAYKIVERTANSL